MARRIIRIKTKFGDRIEYRRPLLAEDDYSHIGIKTPVYGWPELEIEGDFEFEVEELRSYVQVEFVTPMSGLASKIGTLYTYIDPGLELEVGDLVEVPTVFKDHNLALVRKLGPDDAVLARHIVKEVSARYAKIDKEIQDEASARLSCGPEYGCFCDGGACDCDGY